MGRMSFRSSAWTNHRGPSIHEFVPFDRVFGPLSQIRKALQSDKLVIQMAQVGIAVQTRDPQMV